MIVVQCRGIKQWSNNVTCYNKYIIVLTDKPPVLQKHWFD